MSKFNQNQWKHTEDMQKYKYKTMIQFIDLFCDRKAYKYDRELFVLEIKEENE